MINRKILYGYRIRNGILEIVPEEQQTVKRIFTLYNAGASYQGISDALNQGNIPYSQEVPLWNKHKVKRLLENPRYTGQDDYPAREMRVDLTCLELWSLRGQQPAHETRCFAEGNTDISAPISEISAMAVIMFPEKPRTV